MPKEPPVLQPGTITRLQVQKKNAERISVYLDDAFAFGIALDVLIEAELKKGDVLSVAVQEQLLAADELIRARVVAVNYIAYQARTEEEVRRRLRKAEFSEPAVEGALERMKALGYLDDDAFAQAYAKGRFAGRGYGPQRIRADLLKKGVRGEALDRAVAAVASDDDLFEQALRHGRKRWLRLQSESDPRKREKKLADFLLRRGFSYDTVRAVTDRLKADDASGP